MVCLGFVTEFCCFRFDEVSDMNFICKFGPAAKARIRTDAAIASCDRPIKMRVRCKFASSSNFHVAQHATCPYPHVITEPHCSFEYAIHIDEDIGAAM